MLTFSQNFTCDPPSMRPPAPDGLAEGYTCSRQQEVSKLPSYLAQALHEEKYSGRLMPRRCKVSLCTVVLSLGC